MALASNAEALAHLQAHHVDPRREDGIDAETNLVTVCARCPASIEAESA
jgi:hypothetical protein